MPDDISPRDPYALCKLLIAALAAGYPELIPGVSTLMHKLRPRRHGPGFSSVLWDGERYVFSASQAAVIELLWDAMENDTYEVRQELLLEAAGSESEKLANLFRDHSSWGVLVVPGSARGTFRLPA